MSDSSPAIALLFGDSELGVQLREALNECGAQIVHEGEVSTFSRNVLEQVGADVLVVNLDDSADDALDQLYDVIDGDRPRVVFNDAQASRALAGWDRARWARHLSVKVMAAGDIDPPRPDNARGFDTLAVAAVQEITPADLPVVAEPILPPVKAPVHEAVTANVEAAREPAFDPDSVLHGEDEVAHDAEREQQASSESQSLAAELEAMLASGDLPIEDQDESGPGLRQIDGKEPPPLDDGNFADVIARPEQPVASVDEPAWGDIYSIERTEAPLGDVRPNAPPAEFQTDHLQLSPLTDPAPTTIPATAAEPASAAATVAVRAPDSWALLDGDAEQASVPESEKIPAPETFGIQPLSAADFLAPDVESSADDAEATMSLELVSMEEAVAPQACVHESEHVMVLDEPGSALSRIVLLGAATSSIDSVCAFLGTLPSTTRLAFLHTQHLGDYVETALVERFAANCALPVRLAGAGDKAREGEVLVVPAGQQVRLRRDGKVELQANGSETVRDPSIDVSLTMAADAFGRDALAIIFAGRGNDAAAGAQAIHDRGGQVWVESSSGEHFADMVSGIFAERLVSFSGTPRELAAHLIEVFP